MSDFLTPEELANGVTNVYADVGASFAACCISEPHTAAAMLDILVKGLGADDVIWGTDSIWFGSPQWQIEALRRLEIPAPCASATALPRSARPTARSSAIFSAATRYVCTTCKSGWLPRAMTCCNSAGSTIARKDFRPATGPTATSAPAEARGLAFESAPAHS
jgi:hypothetical protein